MIARLLRLASLVGVLVAISGIAVKAATFEVKRAISMDQWVEWPGVERWNDPDVVKGFPEWMRHVTDDQLAYLRDTGLDTVRLPIDPGFLLHSGDVVRTIAIFAGIDKAISRLQSNGLKVIIDMHTIPRGDSGAIGIKAILDDPSVFDDYQTIISMMARRLAGLDPTQVALELINEPTLDCENRTEQSRWNSMLKQLHTTARIANPDITLVLTGACWGSANGLAKLDPSIVNDDNTLWTFHHYEPFKITHQSASWGGPWVQHLANIPYPPTDLTPTTSQELIAENIARIFARADADMAAKIAEGTRFDIDRLRQPARLNEEMTVPFKTVARWADQNGIARNRIFLGEFGIIRQEWQQPPATRPQWRIAYLRDMIKLTEDYGFGWSIWSFGGAFGMVHGFSGKELDNPLLDEVLQR